MHYVFYPLVAVVCLAIGVLGGWIGRTLIPCIPVIGAIAYLIMLFVWSGDTEKEDSFRNWAKAQLIVMGIALAVAVVCVLLGLALS